MTFISIIMLMFFQLSYIGQGFNMNKNEIYFKKVWSVEKLIIFTYILI